VFGGKSSLERGNTSTNSTASLRRVEVFALMTDRQPPPFLGLVNRDGLASRHGTDDARGRPEDSRGLDVQRWIVARHRRRLPRRLGDDARPPQLMLGMGVGAQLPIAFVPRP